MLAAYALILVITLTLARANRRRLYLSLFIPEIRARTGRNIA